MCTVFQLDANSSISMSDLGKNIGNNKRLFKRVIIRREPSQGLGLSIAGGVESNPYIVSLVKFFTVTYRLCFNFVLH